MHNYICTKSIYADPGRDYGLGKGKSCLCCTAVDLFKLLAVYEYICMGIYYLHLHLHFIYEYTGYQ